VEQVVLLDETGHATGVMDKAVVHHDDTPLHLAFSCYIFSRGELLLTRRAFGKSTWPGVWTNTCCGHPAPGEPLSYAVRRRLRDELGIQVSEPSLILPRFRYRATMSNGVVENEMCPVFYAFGDAEPQPNPDEVADTCWVDWQRFSTDVLAGSTSVSPWCEQQVRELAELGTEPSRWPIVRNEDLPAAAR
jgi:isopentenyl-diphosphate Delta-isomerase